MVLRPVQILADDSEYGNTLEANDTPGPGRILVTGADGRLPVQEGVDINSTGGLLIHGSNFGPLSIASAGDMGDGLAIPGVALSYHSTAGVQPYILFATSKGATVDTPLISADTDVVGVIAACGHDGVDHEVAAQINFVVDGTPGSNDMPGGIDFQVTPEAGHLAATALRIRSNKTVECAAALTVATTLQVTGLVTLAATQKVVTAVSETVTAASLVDGGAAIGTKVLTMSIPVGALLIGSKVVVTAGFAGDVSATLKIGDGSDDDRYMTGTPSIFATAANGIETGVPSGGKLITTANTPTVTVTSATEIDLVMAGGGSMVVTIYYLATV